jgi:hypothetical protein
MWLRAMLPGTQRAPVYCFRLVPDIVERKRRSCPVELFEMRNAMWELREKRPLLIVE